MRVTALVLASICLVMPSSSTAQSRLDASERLSDLAFLALDHGISSIEKSGPLVPFVVTEGSGERQIHRFVAEPYEESVAKARAYCATLAPSIAAYALAYDGYITLGGVKYDAIIVHAAERGGGDAYLVAQRYKPTTAGNPLAPIGNAAYLGREATLFRNAP